MDIVDKICKTTAKIATILSGLLLLSVFVVLFIEISGRFMGKSPSWTEELSRWGLVAMCFSGASAALYNKSHVGVNIIVTRLPFPVAKICTAIAYLCGITLCIFFGYYCFLAAMRTVNLKGDIIPVSMIYVKMFLPLGFFMMFIQLLGGLIKLFDKRLTAIADATIGS
ncbi:TRAP transporter small permease [Treponema sp. Marseille-Q4130]|uniref:TRAP transporter small permease n=1 Tax=Treponema sp. Marseille-Q4130 TaxID=2766702 RepID=UPI001652B2D6|nr:TRAP transporter small permease [Treponema sp. Marseille-Q4130]MBC6721247.1 TRAP transporter small permease [Treponema sp. Marseille-Q4130]